MKSLFQILLLLIVSCVEEDPEARQEAIACRLIKMEQPSQWQVSLRDEISYKDGKLDKAVYHTKQASKNNWDYVETREFTHMQDRIEVKVTRPAFTINGSFIFDSNGNLLEYSDDFFAHVYRYEYEGGEFSDDDIRYIVRNGNIVERVDLNTGVTIDRFTYDSHPNPLKNLFYEPIGNDYMEYFRFYNANNVLTETGPNAGTVSYSYIYNANGYPTKKTRVGTDLVVNYYYECD